MNIKLKKTLKGSHGKILQADNAIHKVLELNFRKKRYLIEVNSRSWFIDFRQAVKV